MSKFKPGQSGNPAGRPKSAFVRNVMLAKTFRERADEFIQKTIELALAGDVACLKLCLERAVPVLKKEPIEFAVPDLKNVTPEQLVQDLFESMGGQTMSVDDIQSILTLIKHFRDKDDSVNIAEFVAKSNEVLEELRAKNEREY